MVLARCGASSIWGFSPSPASSVGTSSFQSYFLQLVILFLSDLNYMVGNSHAPTIWRRVCIGSFSVLYPGRSDGNILLLLVISGCSFEQEEGKGTVTRTENLKLGRKRLSPRGWWCWFWLGLWCAMRSWAYPQVLAGSKFLEHEMWFWNRCSLSSFLALIF